MPPMFEREGLALGCINLRQVVLTLLFLTLTHHSAEGRIFGPNNIEDCMLEISKDAKSDEAANIGMRACIMKFQEPTDSKGRGMLGAYINGECNFYWTGFEFLPGVKKKPFYVSYGVGHSDGFKVVVWISKFTVDDWRERKLDPEATVKSIIVRYENYIMNSCKKMTPK